MTTSCTPVPVSSAAATAPYASVVQHRRLVVHGIVQGVGFRPFVHRTATALGLTGSVRNDGARVIIEAVGTAGDLEALHDALVHRAPPLARVEQVVTQRLEGVAPGSVSGERFVVAESHAATEPQGTSVRLTADAGICARCEAELMDPRNRRHRHAFISCTDCGPRWSMVAALPYDRERTSMRTFPLCPHCAKEYRDPGDRRFHAESVCCPACGPTLSAWDAGRASRGTNDLAIAAAAAVLRTGGIVALHGIGGFHLAVDATNASAVARLRARKHRPAKPFAVMVRTMAEARRLVTLDATSAALLECAERPVVVAPMLAESGITASVAPGLTELGVMLPSTAVHHLLLHDTGLPLVMTSGNASGEPLAATPDDAWRDLSAIADLLLVHDRPVVAPSDDTVLRREPAGALCLRRARGWSPARVTLPIAGARPTLGLGADLKATVALADGAHAWLSPHLGDQASLAVQQRTAETVTRLVALSGVVPAVVVCDAHPGYASTAMLARWLQHPEQAPWGRDTTPRVHTVQHHHAHVAAVLAEHAVRHPVVALAFDGAGWGTDGTVWGGEVLVADLAHMQRVGALAEAPLIGGDLAAREPWRAALGWLHDTPGAARDAVQRGVPALHLHVAGQVATRRTTMRTSSMGRLFDAAAAVLHLVPANSYEGEAAARLEALAGTLPMQTGVPFPVIDAPAGAPAHAPWRLDPRDALERLAWQHRRGESPERLAAQWHDDVTATCVLAAQRALDEHLPGRSPTVVLCGGVFQNVRLLHAVRSALTARGMTVLAARTLPANDGAIAIGQVAIAAAMYPRHEDHRTTPPAMFDTEGSNS